MSGLWGNNPATKEGKYLVLRRDGSVVDWPYFVIGARDTAAPAALRAYANAAEYAGMDAVYVADVRDLADDFECFCNEHGPSDPDAGPHRKDNPEIVAQMKLGRSA